MGEKWESVCIGLLCSTKHGPRLSGPKHGPDSPEDQMKTKHKPQSAKSGKKISSESARRKDAMECIENLGYLI